METATTLNKLKEQAEINAMKRLHEQFSTADQLEQIEQHINRSEKRKNMVENQLKSAIQSHFISVNSCMEQLKDVNNGLMGVRETMYSIQEDYKTISHLENTLGELRNEASKHKQLKSAKENVRNLLNVDDLAKQASKYIDDNKMLLAHKCLLDMEKCRNDILEELGPASDKSANISDIKLVDDFFKKLRDLNKTLHNNIFVTIKRMLEVSKSYPEQLVSALRIIEREEILDDYWLKKKEETGFIPPDRPKKWRKECKDTIRNIIETKILGLRIEERETDDSWFSKHLGNVCSRLSQDLEIVKKLCEPCFPPSYHIFNYFIESVHEILSDYIKQLLDQNQLRGKEYFVLLSWQDTYKSTYFLGNPALQLDIDKIPDILDEVMYKKVLEGHLDYTMNNMAVWFKNALEKNFKEWLTNAKPKIIEGYQESSMPDDINTMLISQLDLISVANDDRFAREVLKFMLKQLSGFTESLKGKIYDFKSIHYKNPEMIKGNFIGRMVTTSNDCIRLRDCILHIRDKYDTFMDKDEIGGPNDNYESIGNQIIRVSDTCLDTIIDDMSKCLDEQYFKILLSKEWLTNDKIITTIVATSNDYMGDLENLKPEGQLHVLIKWHNRIKVEYMKGFMQNLSTFSMVPLFRKCQLTDLSERNLFASKITKEVLALEMWFKEKSASLSREKNLIDFEVLTLMTKLIKADDLDFLGVEIGALVNKCPGITSDMLFALLSLRGDITKSDYKEKYEDYVVKSDTQKNDKSKSPKSAAASVTKTDEAMVILKRELKIQ